MLKALQGNYMLLKKNFKIILTSLLSLFVIISIGFAVFKERQETTEAEVKKKQPTFSHHYIAYYFHGNARCQSCYKIESYTSETIKTKFAKELSDGTVTWEAVNVEEGMNQRYVQKYSLNTKSVVLSEVENGKEIKWKNLDKVWKLLGNQTQFQAYIEAEVKDFLKANKT
ncbi:MAG: hypothetical protein A2504_02320 [Bdellovibrionales bacterium RIFOXYD12_FULL_39_22]|nr:MAG: hypothetical protein A2385_12345 [Bdellovibrionales bacterium RIFOXYB1_FULL_39_21]OFZ41430.1 MAG: hypothetical protein A2485_01515 [Bdellovibrionales bacterium RIFOXYC12_FULL_39_17]OFZ45386.1 MAG: hypothetical protein A2404_13530 [Bdellovibrionales bacterium RIFOXYC1_FULL_39_130]OFZ71233.1 MAG: hypothetical protein A2451_14025 [Bdellovibrionales bacterium RIFOXYC2_FULL_39_8]OFZ74582.1 MAG: hypothetical protein A2560_12635 [Bdellovibrionales bacterium RIFOXYD1_FULL_39_84]OFZ92590.1 MAG: